MHEHILEIRNTLVAHNDFEQIEPRILSVGFKVEESSILIPTTIWIANKCISYPSDLDGVMKIKNHAYTTLLGVGQKLSQDITRFRLISIEHTEQAEEAKKYSKTYGKDQIPVGGASLITLDFKSEEWLDSAETDFSEVHNGYHYESMRFKQEFAGPEKINLPNGTDVLIMPSPK